LNVLSSSTHRGWRSSIGLLDSIAIGKAYGMSARSIFWPLIPPTLWLDLERNGTMEKCNCGSGLRAEAIYDARNIFLTFACDKCKEQRLRTFRPDVLVDPNYWHDEPIDE
jgi:hypothetical protein